MGAPGEPADYRRPPAGAAQREQAEQQSAPGSPQYIRPTAAFIIALIGGIFLTLQAASALQSATEPQPPIPYTYLGLTGAPLVTLLVIAVAFGLLVAASSFLVFVMPWNHDILGPLILALSIVGVFIVPNADLVGGATLGIVGGALAIAYRPRPLDAPGAFSYGGAGSLGGGSAGQDYRAEVG